MLSRIFELVEFEKKEILSNLADFISLRSVSARMEGIDECVGYLEKLLQENGFQVSVLQTPTGRHAVYAEKKGRGKSLLLYNHYDVQPPEPLEEWSSEPFKLVEKDGLLFGRGLADNKGEIVARLAAVRVVEKALGYLPITVKWLIEGEEEVGSPSISKIVNQNLHRFRDVVGCVWEGGDVVEDVPNFYLGVKGMLYVELRLKTAEADAHSMYAPVIENAAEKLARKVISLKDRNGRITIPGFYEQVLKPSRVEKATMAGAKLSSTALARDLGVKKLTARGDELLEKLVYEPTCNIAGFVSGYTGPGSKTITPSNASVKIDFRLVPNQDPDKVLRGLKKALPDVEIIVHSKAHPARISLDEPIVKAALKCAEKVYGRRPRVLPNMFGTGPLYHFTRAGIPTAMVSALAHPGSRLHAPNENIYQKHLLKSVAHHSLLFIEVGEQA
ncbi:MAG: M20/M25/M40 family metallo-hydrolase [Candidatus Caldarchaeum sp.]|nr:M20/M25/M40 family metallo-hydrolase [Candidatus Caldarchaeum sp.]